jgi:acetyl esterase/lipase
MSNSSLGHRIEANAGTLLNNAATVGDILNHPALRPFARLILPWDNRSYNENMRLKDIASLLPYHTHVDPALMIAALNHMIGDAKAGKQIFYHIYTEAQRYADPSKNDTGLFFFRGRTGAPFAVVCPGGGFSYVGSIHEGFPYAMAIGRRGYNASVLKYRVGQGARPATEDLAAAISFIIGNAAELGVGADDYSLWGSSAGARMAAAIGSRGVQNYSGDDLPKPSAIIMAYTAHMDHSSDEPPTFVIAGERDQIAPPSIMERRIAALRLGGAPVEYHKFQDLAHGFGPGIGTSAEGWLDDAITFWERFIVSWKGNGEA